MNRGTPSLPKPTFRDLSGMELDGRYRLVRLVGAGGMGSVYEGQHIVLGTQVAIKVLKPDLGADEKFRVRFLREARAASAIPNKHIVRATDFGTTPSGLAYFVMDFLEGRDLQQVLREVVRLSWGQFRPILLQIIDALAAAHEHEIVHRDIKPANIFLARQDGDPNFVKVLDFGIAKMAADGGTGLTATDELFGTVSYMAPELAEGKKASAASDIYSLGVLMYYTLTGQLPFGEGTPFQILARHIQQSPRPPRQWVPQIPEPVETTILAMMAKEPAHRPPQLRRVLEHLSRALYPRVEGVPTPRKGAIFESTRTAESDEADLCALNTLVAVPAPESRRRTERSPRSASIPAAQGPAVPSRRRTGTMPSAMAAKAAARVVQALATGGSMIDATPIGGRAADRPEGIAVQQEPIADDEYERKVRARRRLTKLLGISVSVVLVGGVVAALATGGFRADSRPTRESLYRAEPSTTAVIRPRLDEGERIEAAVEPDAKGVVLSPELGAIDFDLKGRRRPSGRGKANHGGRSREQRAPPGSLASSADQSSAPTDDDAKERLRNQIPAVCELGGQGYFVWFVVDEEGHVRQTKLTGFGEDAKRCAINVIRDQEFRTGTLRSVTFSL